VKVFVLERENKKFSITTTNTKKEEKGREIFFSARRKAFFYSRFAFSRAHPSRPDLTIYSLKTEEEEEEEEE